LGIFLLGAVVSGYDGRDDQPSAGHGTGLSKKALFWHRSSRLRNHGSKVGLRFRQKENLFGDSLPDPRFADLLRRMNLQP
jgi:hypothetical protein